MHRPALFSVGLFRVIIVAYYLPARKEERVVLGWFGDEYPVYMSQVSMFISRWGWWGRLIWVSGRAKMTLHVRMISRQPEFAENQPADFQRMILSRWRLILS